jgi:hypothetical protein
MAGFMVGKLKCAVCKRITNLSERELRLILGDKNRAIAEGRSEDNGKMICPICKNEAAILEMRSCQGPPIQYRGKKGGGWLNISEEEWSKENIK